MAEYIEKQAALDIVNGWRDQLIPTYGENDEYVKCLETVAEHLELLHAADVWPVRRGRWKKNDNGTYSCERCHSWIPEEQWHYANWCLYCGADMREGKP